jgi:hypothetical protein
MKPILDVIGKSVRRALAVSACLLAACGVSDPEPLEPVAPLEEELESFVFNFSPIEGGIFSSAPAIIARGATYNVFGKGSGSDNRIWSNFWSSSLPGSGWFGWQPLPGSNTFTSKPSAATDGTRMFVAAKGTDNRLYVNAWINTTTQWQGWNAVKTTTFDTAPALAYASGYLYLMARRPGDLRIYWSRVDISSSYNPANWSTFAIIPDGVSAAEPAAVFDGNNLRVVARRDDNRLYITSRTGSTWAAWSEVERNGALAGTTFKHGPAISSWGNGHVDVFSIGSDDQLYFTSRDSTGSWYPLRNKPGETYIASPAAWSRPGESNKVAVVGERADTAFYYSVYDRPCPNAQCPDQATSGWALSLWPEGKIYYQWSPDASSEGITWVVQAMNDWKAVTHGAVQFIHNPAAPVKLTVYPNGGGYGHVYGECVNFAAQGQPCNLLVAPDNAYHEIGHTIGILHAWYTNEARHYIRYNNYTCTDNHRAPAGFDFGPFDFRSTMMYPWSYPEVTRFDGSGLCATGQACSDQVCARTPLVGCPGGHCPLCTVCEKASPMGFPTPLDAAKVVEAYGSQAAPRWKRFKRAVNEDTGAGANQPYNYSLSGGVAIPRTRSLAATAYPNGWINLFVLGANNVIQQKSKLGTLFSQWTPFPEVPGAGVISDPAAVSWAQDRQDLVVRRGNTIYIRTFSSLGSWGNWGSLGSLPSPVTAASAPAISSWGTDRLDVFVRGSNDQLYWKKCTFNCNGQDGTWSNWTPVPGGTFRGKPTAISRTANMIDVFVHGMDGRLYGVQMNNEVWGGYYLAQATATLKFDGSCSDCSSPAVMARPGNKLTILYRGLDDQVWKTDWEPGSSWSTETSLGGVLTSSPTGISRVRHADRIDFFGIMEEERAPGTFVYGPWWKEYTP